MSVRPDETTAARLAEIEARAKAASSGPWKRDAGPDGQWDLVIIDFAATGTSGLYYGFEATHDVREAQTDAEFIAHARADIPFLLALLRARTDEAGELREALVEARPYVLGCRLDWTIHEWRRETARDVLARVDAALTVDGDAETTA